MRGATASTITCTTIPGARLHGDVGFPAGFEPATRGIAILLLYLVELLGRSGRPVRVACPIRYCCFCCHCMNFCSSILESSDVPGAAPAEESSCDFSNWTNFCSSA